MLRIFVMAGSCITITLALLTSLLILLLLTVLSEGGDYGCPSKCQCHVMKEKSGRKVICQNNSPPISNITQSFTSNLPKGTVHLDLSGNEVTYLEKNSFEGLQSLIKLNLSGNPIAGIQAKSFNGLDNLEKLDLSGMKLSYLNASMLEGMPKLKRLYLLGTAIQTIQQGTFDSLPALTRLDLQTDLLVCDCHLQWMTTWLQNTSVRLDVSAVCGLPSVLRGKPFRTLEKHDLHCDSPLELAVFELTPSTNQIVFAGDKLPLQCRASFIDRDMTMSWHHNGMLVVSNRTLGVFVHAQSLPDQLLMTSMVLEQLAVAHSGSWECLVESARGNVSKSVKVIVFAENTAYCSQIAIETSRGKYSWPKTLAGVVQMQPCEIVPTVVPFGYQKASAKYFCNASGIWTDLDISRCPFSSQMTQDLDSISRVSTNRSCRVECALSVITRITENSHDLGNVEDVIFLSHIISNFSKNIRSSELMARSLIDLSSSVMDLPTALLIAAQKQDQACSRIVKAVEEIADQLLQAKPTVSLHSQNIALQGHKIQPYLFGGINCTSWVGLNRTALDQFMCITNGEGRTQASSLFDASIEIPTDILTQIRCASTVCPQNDTIRIQAILYRNAKLFPVDENLSPLKVTSGVIASRIAGARVVNSTSPITVKMASPRTGTGKIPVHWDFNANGEQGAWLSTGCVLVSYVPPLVTYKCNHLTNFAVAEGQLPPPTALEEWLLSCYNTSIITYMGSAVLVVCLLTVSVVYVVHRRNIRMSRKMRHAIVNLSLCLAFLCITYTFGIRLHHLSVPCRVVGVTIHYLSLCTLFWITAISFKMQHQLSKQELPQPPPEELSSEPPKPKPIIAGYLLGWGVAVIICGISGAINWANYELPEKYCFLSMDAAFMTVFVPAGILGFFNLVLFFRIFCLVQRIPSTTPSSVTVKTSVDEPDLEEMQENEIQLLSSNQTTNSGTDTVHSSNCSSSPFTSGSSPFDKTYGPGSQLLALVLVPLLYCSLWMAGAFAVTLPLSGILPHHDVVFQCLYAILASALGAFMLVFYCVGRKDVRSSCCSNSSILNDWKYVPANGNSLPKCAVEEPVVIGVPVSAENISLTSRSVHSNGIDASKISSNAAMPRPAGVVEPSFTAIVDSSIFYNPHQNGVAKKYWERSKRKRAIQLRKEVTGASADDEPLGLKNGHIVTADHITGHLTTDLNMEMEQPNTITGHESFPGCVIKPHLPILSPLLPQQTQARKETSENWADAPKSNLDSPRGVEKAFLNQDELGGVKQGQIPNGGIMNSNRVRDSLHEPMENGFLEQLELRIPQPAIPNAAMSSALILTAKEKTLGMLQNMDNACSVVLDKNPSLTVSVPEWAHCNNDLNGNKNSDRLPEKQSGTSDNGLTNVSVCDKPEKTGSNCCPTSVRDLQKINIECEDSTLTGEDTLNIWEEQQKADLKLETSV